MSTLTMLITSKFFPTFIFIRIISIIHIQVTKVKIEIYKNNPKWKDWEILWMASSQRWKLNWVWPYPCRAPFLDLNFLMCKMTSTFPSLTSNNLCEQTEVDNISETEVFD